MIDFEMSQPMAQMRDMIHAVAESQMRPIARKYDEEEHEKPWEFIDFMWGIQQSMGGARATMTDKEEAGEKAEKKVREGSLINVVVVEELSWGDTGIYLSIPNPGLGGAAVMAAGTPEQRQHFLGPFSKGKPKWGAMAITESHAGSDTANIKATAVRDGDEWVLNGEKIFVTSGKMAAEHEGGFIVVWASIDKSAGRSGIKSFVVPAGTPGMTVTKLEDKLGIRASDTASLVFEDCRIPLDHMLGVIEKKGDKTKGFKGAMATFDASRPAVAASAIGIAQAALEHVKEALKKTGVEIPYGAPLHKLSAVQREVMQMEADLQGARLLTYRAAWMMDRKIRNNLEASMAKAMAGVAATRVTHKAVELLGPLGYSRDYLPEKWIRDAKINDIFEGTQQINLLIVARRILDYSSRELT